MNELKKELRKFFKKQLHSNKKTHVVIFNILWRKFHEELLILK